MGYAKTVVYLFSGSPNEGIAVTPGEPRCVHRDLEAVTYEFPQKVELVKREADGSWKPVDRLSPEYVVRPAWQDPAA